ncbi:hypothetical protein [Aeromonas salmonicida]|nr:hypothetical protein [Aeromonas salmonicida]
MHFLSDRAGFIGNGPTTKKLRKVRTSGSYLHH